MRAKMFKGTALVVSGNDRFKRPLQNAFSRAGYSILFVRSQEEGLEELQRLNPTLVIIDRTESGFARLHHALPDQTPIVTVSNHPGLCDEHHCVLDIEDGATRAVCNAGPFVIVALAEAVLRRQRWQQPGPDHFTIEDLTIDFANHEVKVGTTAVSITPTQFRILRSLAAAPGQFLSRQALLDQVWGAGFAICPHTLDVNLSSLRRILESNGTSRDFIVTIKGVGFKIRSTSPLGTIAPRPAASTVARTPSPMVSPFWNPRAGQDVFKQNGAIWRNRTGRPMPAGYRTKRLPFEAKQVVSSHMDRHVGVAEHPAGIP